MIEKNMHTRRTRFSLSSKTTTYKIDGKEKRKMEHCWFCMLESESGSFPHPTMCRPMRLRRPEELERLVHTHTHTEIFLRQNKIEKNVTRLSHLWNNWCKIPAYTTTCQPTHSTTRLEILNVLFDLLCPTHLIVMWFIIFCLQTCSLKMCCD